MSARCFFVTGAAGFVGRHLCRHLRAAGHHVRGLVRRPDAALTALGIETVVGDVCDAGPWQQRLAGAEFVIHCAANAAFANGDAFEKPNVEGTRLLLDATRQPGVLLRRFVFVSTMGTIDRAAEDACTLPLDENFPAHPSTDYGRSKEKAERLVRDSGVPYAIVRPTAVVGGDMRTNSHFAVFVRKAVLKAAFARFAWPGTWNVIHVDDLCAGLEVVAVHPDAAAKTFFCAGKPVSLRECFDLAQPAARIPVAWAAGVAKTAPRLVPFKLKAVLLPALTASDAALQALGWRPRLSASEALRDVITRERAKIDPQIDPGGQTIVTGAASGLGLALVRRLAPLRANLLLVDRDRAGLERVQQSYPQARVRFADLADEREVTELVGSAEWRALPVREIFACAGMGIRGPMLATPAERHAQLFKVNVLARLALAHAALPDMVRAQFGRIVFISSSSAFQPLPYMASYAASNAALLSLGEAWGAELTDTGVHLLQVCPGGMQTNFQASAGVKKISGEKLMAPEEVVESIWRALARRQSTAIVSTRSLAMSLLARLLPRRTSVWLWKRLMTQLR
ncbi:MAG TPA: SDR family NAD(P)-dependent oxidoreductase [Opitutaceae bacterium]|nr:SDR family NAD(P)-dependent oxidoreductase [Opitutaceae bacterium]